jgi:MFS family permease
MSSSSALSSAVRKIKWHVLPLFVVMFIVNYIDRVNIGFVRQHLSADLGIGAAAYGLGAGLFFVSYAVFEVPSNMLMQRFGAKAWLTRIMITWGLAAVGMAFVKGETSFYAMRLLLGAAEAGFFPGVVLYFTQWLPRDGRRSCSPASYGSGSIRSRATRNGSRPPSRMRSSPKSRTSSAVAMPRTRRSHRRGVCCAIRRS